VGLKVGRCCCCCLIWCETTENLKITTGVRLCACCACVFYRLLVKNTGSPKVTESTCATDARAQFLGSTWWEHRLEAGDAEGVLVVDFGCPCVATDANFIGFLGHLLKTDRVVSYE
jgi:hypothetical protein